MLSIDIGIDVAKAVKIAQDTLQNAGYFFCKITGAELVENETMWKITASSAGDKIVLYVDKIAGVVKKLVTGDLDGTNSTY